MRILALFFLGLLMLPGYAASSAQGEYLGAKLADNPVWFKDSFLEFEEDVKEAAAANKRVMIYFHQEGCPYCARLVDENFTDPDTRTYMQQYFESIQVNMWGDREIVSVGGKKFTEKTFAAALKVQYTPTILFLNEQGGVALRLNGYYPVERFRLALRYAAQRQDKVQSFNEFVVANTGKVKAEMAAEPVIEEDFFLPGNRLADPTEKYRAVYFESAGCEDCRLLHEKVLSDAPTRELVKKMVNVQMDINSDQPVKTVEGLTLSQRDYARRLNIGYTPSVVFYDPQGKEVHRIDGFLKTFHFQSSLAYVLEQGYLSQPSFQRYISERGEKLRALGFDTDIWGYESFHPAGNEK